MTIERDDDALLKMLREFVRSGNGKHYPVASLEAILTAEESLKVALPPLLARIYREVANGGFGPHETEVM